MAWIRPLFVALALAGMTVTVSTRAANAQEMAELSASGLVSFLPVGPVTGDGHTPVQMYAVAIGPDGAPINGFAPKLQASAGDISEWRELGGGIYGFVFVPPKVNAATSAIVSLKGKAGRANVAISLPVEIEATAPRSISVSANPERLILGTDGEATLSFVVSGTGEPVHAADLQVSASAGQVANLVEMGGGKFTARFVAPRVNYPHIAIVTVADRRDPLRVFGHVAIPLNGKIDYPVKAAPGAAIVLRIGDREFGPATAGQDGKAAVPVIVPPGVRTATLVTVISGEPKEESLDLKVPETRRLRILELPATLVAGSPVPVRVAIRAPEGAPDLGAQVHFSAPSGSFGAARHEGNGIYVADFTPVAGAGGVVSVEAALEGLPAQVDQREVEVVANLAAGISVAADPTSLAPDKVDATLYVTVLGEALQELFVDVGPGRLRGFIEKGDAGEFVVPVSAEPQKPIEAVLIPVSKEPGERLSRLVLLPIDERVGNDGASRARIAVLTLDEQGRPVPHVLVTLSAEADGSVPANVTTGAEGAAVATYTSGKLPGLVRVRGQADVHKAAAALWQVPSTLSVPGLLTPGDAVEQSAVAAWRALVAKAAIPRGTNAVATVSAVPTGPAATLQIRAGAPLIPAGGAAVLWVRALDSEGRGATGQTLNVRTSLGTLGPTTELGSGDYEISLSIPSDAKGEAQVSVASGAVTSSIKVPVGAPVATANATKPPRRNDVHLPLDRGRGEFRIGAGYVTALYRYAQESVVEDGPLFPMKIEIGGDSGGAYAKPQGFAVNSRAVPEGFPYVGLDAEMSVVYYAITAEEFAGAVIPHSSIAAAALGIGRVPFGAGAFRAHAGLRAGFRYSDFLVLLDCPDGDCVVQYDSLPLPALSLGLELGAKTRHFTALLAADEGVNAVGPFVTDARVEIGYGFSRSMFASLAFRSTTREVGVYGAENTGTLYGELRDGQRAIMLAVGYAR